MTEPLPRVEAEIVPWSTVWALFTDLEALAELREVRLKGSAAGYAEAGTVGLAEARRALAERRVSGVQLRYRHAGREWCDTLIIVAEGVRVVRLALGEGGTP